MSNKTGTSLDKHIKEENLHKLKASEITEVKQAEQVYIGLGFLTLVTLFILLISFVAYAIWGTKLTLFILIVMGLVNAPMIYLTFSIKKHWKKTVNRIANRVNNIKGGD